MYCSFWDEKDGVEGNIEFKNYSSHEWMEYLANCKAIIGTAGLSLISEALYLKKPYLTVPVKKQTDKIINAKYLEEMGYGMAMNKFRKIEIEKFINKIPGNLEKNLL